jgi:hypothetical protein
MHRTQIRLTESQAAALKELAMSRDTSVAELVRQAVDILLMTSISIDQDKRERRALAAVGRFSSGHQDIAAEHDRYLENAYLNGDTD